LREIKSINDQAAFIKFGSSSRSSKKKKKVTIFLAASYLYHTTPATQKQNGEIQH